jgi:chorismate synthase
MSSGANSFGSRFVVTTFGESHGAALGAVIDGCPAGVDFDLELLRHELARRRPGGELVSGRKEADEPEVLSGVYQGKTLGTPIAIVVRNLDARSQDYVEIAKAPRPGHADDVWESKFGHRDPRGGGRSSGRETVARVMAGAVARMVLKELAPEFRLRGFARRIGPLELGSGELGASEQAQVEALLLEAKREGKSHGGVAELWIDGIPAGLGQPVFHKLKADLGAAMLGVGAVSGVEIGEGFAASSAEGTEFYGAQGSDSRYGGIRGGISTGERLVVRVPFKPTSTVMDLAKKGRHDPCIVPRAIPVLEAMASLVIVDHLLWMRLDRLK